MAACTIEKRSGGYYLTGSRVSLASIVYQYQNGASMHSIQENFPTLSIDQVNEAIEFYQANRVEVETHLRVLEAKWKDLESSAIPDPALQHRVEEAKKRRLAKPA